MERMLNSPDSYLDSLILFETVNLVVFVIIMIEKISLTLTIYVFRVL
jgi:hypothetical protein